MLNSIVVTGRRLARRVLGRSPGFRAQCAVPHQRIGTSYGGWTVATGPLSRDSVVYSFGVGEDISFDLGMIARFGVTVHAFDPTPRSIAWLRAQSVPDQFRFYDFGIAAYDGTARFFPPHDDAHVSFSTLGSAASIQTAVDAPVRRLSSIMRELDHCRVDILKLDIEGSEYDVLEDLVRSEIPVTQLLVEFHHFFKNIPVSRTRAAIRMLNAAGFELFNISNTEREFSLLHRSARRS